MGDRQLSTPETEDQQMGDKATMGEGEEVSATKVFSLEEVKRHAKGGPEKDVWIVIHDNVYDVTKFLDEHPGGEEVLFDSSGTDGTEPFEDVGHSTDARDMMEEYLIGTLQEADRKGTQDKGPKSWASSGDSSSGAGGGDEGSGLMTWIVPAALAFAGAMIYRTYFANPH